MEIPSVGEIICSEIRQRIFDGQYASGDHINVDDSETFLMLREVASPLLILKVPS